RCRLAAGGQRQRREVRGDVDNVLRGQLLGSALCAAVAPGATFAVLARRGAPGVIDTLNRGPERKTGYSTMITLARCCTSPPYVRTELSSFSVRPTAAVFLHSRRMAASRGGYETLTHPRGTFTCRRA